MEEREYFEVVEKFMQDIYTRNVGGIVMVAILEDDDDHDVMMRWNVSPFGMTMAAGIIQLAAAKEYCEIKRGRQR